MRIFFFFINISGIEGCGKKRVGDCFVANCTTLIIIEMDHPQIYLYIYPTFEPLILSRLSNHHSCEKIQNLCFGFVFRHFSAEAGRFFLQESYRIFYLFFVLVIVDIEYNIKLIKLGKMPQTTFFSTDVKVINMNMFLYCLSSLKVINKLSLVLTNFSYCMFLITGKQIWISIILNDVNTKVMIICCYCLFTNSFYLFTSFNV